MHAQASLIRVEYKIVKTYEVLPLSMCILNNWIFNSGQNVLFRLGLEFGKDVLPQ